MLGGEGDGEAAVFLKRGQSRRLQKRSEFAGQDVREQRHGGSRGPKDPDSSRVWGRLASGHLLRD